VNNTTVISPVTENAPLVQEIPLDRIVESKTKPPRHRTEFSAALQAGAALRHTPYSRESTYRRGRSSPSGSLG